MHRQLPIQTNHLSRDQGEEEFVIKSGRHSGHAQRPATVSPSKSQSRTAQGSGQSDSTYSYVFPPGGSHR